MRFIFVKELIKKARKNKNIYLITSDLGYRAFEEFKKKFPKRFINVGVAENNMIGVATGLALTGKKVFVYSILPFLIFRSLEQIRNNICHNNLDVNLIGAGGSFSYGYQGVSHNTSEDISIMKSIPNLKIFNPGSKTEVKLVLSIMFRTKSPCLARLGKAPDIDFYDKKILFKNNEGIILQKGDDLTIFTSGNILENVYKTVKKLERENYKICLISCPIVKPLSKNFIIKNIKTPKIMSIEENTEINGLGYYISNCLINENKKIKFKNIALKDIVHNKIGTQDYLRDINNLSEFKLYKVFKKFIQNGK